MFELMEGIRSTLEACRGIKSGDRALVVADNDGGSTWMGQLVMNVVNSMGAEAVLAIIDPGQLGGGAGAWEPPASVALGMKSVNVVFRIADKTSLVHSTARKEATAAGARYFVVHPSLAEDMKRGVSLADLQLIKERTENLAQRLTQAKEARVTTASGTDITMGLTGREGIPLNPLSQLIVSLPDYAEAAIAPVEGTAEGTIVADLAIVQWGYRFGEPLRLKVKAGKVVDISGSKPDADRLRKIASTDESATNVAELGIGTSHLIPWAIHGTRRDAARIGTAHIAIGRNDDIGGKTWSRVHQDGLMSQATIELDGQAVLRAGELLI